MRQRKGMIRAALAWILAGLLTVTAAGESLTLSFGDRTAQDNQYEAYQSRHAGAPVGAETIVIPANSFSPEGKAPQVVGSFHGEERVALLDQTGCDTLWEFTVREAGLYQITLRLYTLKPDTDRQEIGLYLDGAYPFAQAYAVQLPRMYANETAIQTDDAGNQYAPRQTEVFQWVDYTVGFYNLGYDAPMRVYLEAGRHSLGIANKAASFALQSITLSPPEEPPSYAAYRAAHTGGGDARIPVEGEAATLKSDASLRPFSANSPRMSPYSAEHMRINAIGTNWQSPGQWLQWTVQVKQEGYYRVGCRYQQSYKKDFFVTRRLLLDGELPFQEARDIRFPYNADWEFAVLETAAGEELLLYLTPGEHTLRLEMVLGPYRDSVQRLDQVAAVLNELYRKIIVITGVSPDLYQDYALDRAVPGLLDTLEQARESLEEEYRHFQEITATNGAEASFLHVFASQLESMIRDPDGIPARVAELSSNVGSLSAWCQDIKTQPLDIDYLYLAQPDAALPAAKAGFLEQVGHELRAFFHSFVGDYSLMAGADGDGVEVWVSSGRDQAQIIRTMVSDLFTPRSGIAVNLKLVNAGMVEAFLSGNAPDLVLSLGRSLPVNYAMRGLLKDLTAFADFEEVRDYFMPSALRPYYFENGCFALPDTQNFFVQFYRQDTFEQMGLKPPDTWEAFYELLPKLQRMNLDVGIPYTTIGSAGSLGAANIFPALLLQNGGAVYNEALSGTVLDSEQAGTAFEQWCRLYGDYGLDLSYDFFNRFRSGQMPLAIANYTQYTQLQVAAPEISGLWGVTPIPGVRQEDGSIRRTQGGDGSASVILSSTQKPRKSWEFLKWWVGKEAQIRYAQDMQNQVGVLARVAVANVEAFRSLSWPSGMLEPIYEQWQQVEELPELPGGYLLTRGLDNAFRSVLYDGKSPRDTLKSANQQISEEIARKRREFGLE